VDIVDELRRYGESRALPPVTNYRNILFDVLYTVKDIAIPLGRRRDMPILAARVAATRVWTTGWLFWARRRLRGYRFVATDTDWTAVRAPRYGPLSPRCCWY
jgi:hypothetical protein